MAAYGDIEIGVIGLPVGGVLSNEIESFVTSADVSVGRPVFQTPGTTTVKPTFAGGDYFIGVVAASQISYTDQRYGYKAKDVINVLTKGQIYVEAATGASITAPAPAFARVNGTFGATAAGSANLNGAIFRSNAAASAIVTLEVVGPKLITVV